MIEATSAKPAKFLFLLASSRRDGNSEILAQHAAKRLDAGVEQRWVRLMDQPLPPFLDIRHEGDGTYPKPDGTADEILQATLAATDIVFVAPLYWYGLPTLAKHYLDHWSGWMRVPGVDFLRRMATKNMWAVTAVSDEDYSVADPLIGTLKLTADYMKMNWRGALLGFGNRPFEILADHEALASADSFFARATVHA
jgi:multimeric flavodoxin WrbA